MLFFMMYLEDFTENMVEDEDIPIFSVVEIHG